MAKKDQSGPGPQTLTEERSNGADLDQKVAAGGDETIRGAQGMPPMPRSEREDADESAPPNPERRPTVEDLEHLLAQLRPKELETLRAIADKRLGHAGKVPTGRHVTKHGIKIAGTDGKGLRIPPDTILDAGALTEEEVAHFGKHRAIEPEYS